MLAAAARTGSAATAAASRTAQPTGIWTSTGGNGRAAPTVRVMAGTRSQARPAPISSPAAAAGPLSISCSRQSWPAWADLATPSADSTALSARLARTLAATLTENPIAASSIAARPIASAACRGRADSELPSRAAAWWAWSATEEPCSTAGTTPFVLASHHSVTGSG